MKKKIKLWLGYVSEVPFVLYTVLFIGMAIVIFGYFILAEHSFIWVGDGYSQHYIIFSDYLTKLRSFLSGEGFPLWDWTIGLGSDTILSYGYYVIGDPFVYLGLLFPSRLTEFAYHFLIILRIYFVGISFLLFAKWKKFRKPTMVLVSILYAFSHFALYNVIRHPFFILPMIFFPLIILGFEKMIIENNTKYFVAAIFFSALSNFYFFYKMSLLLFFYAIIRFYSFQKKDRTIAYFTSFVIKSLKSYISGLLLASFLFVPIVTGFLTSSRSPGGIDINLWFYPLNYYGAILENFLTPGAYFWLVGGFPVISLLVIPFLWKQKRKHFIWIANLIVLGVLTLFPWFASIMNGFSGPYNRFSFAIPFYLSVGIALTLDSIQDITKEEMKSFYRLLVFFSIVHIVASFIRERYVYYILPLLLGWGMYILIQRYVKGRYLLKTTFVMPLLYGFLILNSVVNAWNYYLPYGKDMTKSVLNYGEIENNYEETFDGLEKLLPLDDDFYRVGVTSKDNQIKNQMIHLNQKGLNSYLSLTNQSISDFSRSLNLKDFQIVQPLRNGLDNRPIANYFLGVKYILSKKENEKYIPEGYRINNESENGDWVVAETDYNFPFAYASSKIISEAVYNRLNPVERENYLLQGNVIEETRVSNKIKPVRIPSTQIALQRIGGETLSTPKQTSQFMIQDRSEKFQLVGDIITEQLIGKQIYIAFKGLDYEPVDWSPLIRESKDYRLTVDIGSKSESVYQSDVYSFSSYFKRDNMLFYLGEINSKEQWDSIRIHFDKEGKYSIEDLSLYVVDYSHEKVSEALEYKTKNELSDVLFSKNTVTGKIFSSQEDILITTIPYTSGWSARINGVEVDPIKINRGFIGVPLKDGENQIELKYKTPGLILGSIISLTTVGVLFFFYLFKKK